MMGSGKSTVGPVLARRLGRSFVDTDACIESRTGLRIAELFAERGEAAFRALEREAVEKAAGTGAVVALGGGAIAQPGAAALLGAAGTVVYLEAAVATLLERIGDPEGRPLLEDVPDGQWAERIGLLLAERQPLYRSARIVVATDARGVEEVVDEIAERVASLESGAPGLPS